MSQNTPLSSNSAALTRQDLAKRMGVHVQTVKRWERAGRLTPRRYGPRTVRYPLAYVEELEREGIPS